MLSAAACVAALALAGSAFGQMTLIDDDRYTRYYIEVVDPTGVSDVVQVAEQPLFGQPFFSNVGDSLAYSGSYGEANVYQSSSIMSDTVSANLSMNGYADAAASESVVTSMMSVVQVRFSLAEPMAFEFEVTSLSKLGDTQAAAGIQDANDSLFVVLYGLGFASGELPPGEYTVAFIVYGGASAEDAASDHARASLIGSFTVSDVVPCIADLTTTGAGEGDPWYGVPDGQITGIDLQYYVNAWIVDDLAIADMTTTGSGEGQPGYGVPDGAVTGADIQYFVNAWILGCP